MKSCWNGRSIGVSMETFFNTKIEFLKRSKDLVKFVKCKLYTVMLCTIQVLRVISKLFKDFPAR